MHACRSTLEDPTDRAVAADLARELVGWLAARGHEAVLPDDDAALAGLDGGSLEGLDLAIALGGDGTMLRTVELVAAAGTPILGVNVGHLGYLTQVEPEGAIDAVARVLAGDHDIEERMLVAVRVEGADGRGPVALALNEAVLERGPGGHSVRIGVHLDGDRWITYAADGMIVASATGSTAYSLSARGPILDPELRALVLTPVSPHMLFDRSLVLSPDIEVGLEVLGPRPATLSIDGRSVGVLEPGSVVTCTAADTSARLVTFGRRDFHRILKAKFGLADR